MRKLMVLILTLLAVAPGRLWAQLANGNPPIPAASHSHKKRKGTVLSKLKFDPIAVNEESYEYYDADNGWTDATSVNYSFKGTPLEGQKDFERVIQPLGDPEADGLLRSAADQDDWGQGLLWGGIAVETAGWTDFAVEMMDMGTSTDSSGRIIDHDPNMVPSTIMILGGVGLILKGVFTQLDADNDRAGAVARYNAVVQSDQKLSMMVLPGSQAVGLGFTQAF